MLVSGIPTRQGYRTLYLQKCPVSGAHVCIRHGLETPLAVLAAVDVLVLRGVSGR